MSYVEKPEETFPWLVFCLKNQYYAISSEKVNGIFQLNQEVTPMKEASQYLRGIIKVRDSMVPILELRKVTGMASFEQELEDFAQVIEQRKRDHQEWVKELKRCVSQHDTFHLATDPHRCALGKWLDNFKTDQQSVRVYLRKLSAPHEELHNTAEKIFKLQKNGEMAHEEIDRLLNECETEHMQTVLKILDEAEQVIGDSYREMCVMISDKEKTLGILVDRVISIEMLQLSQCKKDLMQLGSSLVMDIAESNNINGQILVLDTDCLISYASK